MPWEAMHVPTGRIDVRFLRLQICEDAGNTTTVRSIEPPYAYNTRERRRAAKQRASTFASLIEESDLQAVPSCAWPGGWQSRIKQDQHKVRACMRGS